ncbi:class I SAM-dependent methyltransferase [Clostridium rectalis]|uniref:class I SAM-dependent methyltransferase n=1 Tax=Clostridium rectalis TaxID=2040295 RepID=UPI000F62FA73|nr:class I SAM-dependent methyltransferase [Clostridium rectalis]
MKKELLLNLENEEFRGNTLDIGINNTGVIYNILKNFNKDIEVEYISDKGEEEKIAKGFYDNCMLFFTLSSIWLKLSKKKLIYNIFNYLNEDGYIYIWDIDKGYRKIVDYNIKINLPHKKIREMYLRDINILKDNSKNSTCNILKDYFIIEDMKENDGVYYIKAKKKKIEL